MVFRAAKRTHTPTRFYIKYIYVRINVYLTFFLSAQNQKLKTMFTDKNNHRPVEKGRKSILSL